MSIRSVINSRHDYRADIDGLRAIAILLVIGFHYFPSLVSGGFVGVDIFFVISGFLISKHILTDLNTKSFSYKKFYARRIKRIFPALSVILIFCIIAGWAILTPAEYELLGKHIAAGAGFVSNIFYWKDAGYFDTAADTKPLLHLWSLGIEEQFYILWPLLLVLFRKTKQLSWCLLAALVISLFYNIFLVQHNVVADFYSPLTRFWEFVVGAGITSLALPKAISKINRSLISWIGLGLILIAVMILNKNSLFPGAWALLPTLGAACLIYAGEKAWLNRFILSSRLMVWIGLISYPLYLWHWPLLSMMRIMDGQTPSTETKLILIVISVLLAWLTYKLIEQPIRFKLKSKHAVLMLCIIMFILCVAGLVIRKESGFKSRELSLLNANPKSMQLGADRDKLSNQCGLSAAQQSLFRQSHPCLSDPRAISEYVIFGDSKAEALYYGLVRESQPGKGGWDLMFTVAPGDKIYPMVSQTIINNPKIKVVVFAIAMRDTFPTNPDTGFIDTDVTSLYPGKIAVYSQAIQAYMHAGKRVVFVIDNPTFPDPTSCISGGLTSSPFLNKFLRRKEDPRCTISYTDNIKGTQPYRQFVRELQKANPGLIVYDPTPLLCDKTHNLCTIIKDGNFLYSYSDHISDYANSMIAKDMLPIVYQLTQ